MPPVSGKSKKAKEKAKKMVEARIKKKRVLVATASPGAQLIDTTTLPGVSTPSPSTSIMRNKQITSASKRKQIIFSEKPCVEKPVVKKLDKSVLIKLSDLASIAEKTACKQCGGDISFVTKSVGVDASINMRCLCCDEQFLQRDPKVKGLKIKKHTTLNMLELKLVYEVMNSGLGLKGMYGICSVLDLGNAASRSYYKHKDYIAQKAKEKTAKHLEEAVLSITKIYATELDKYPDEEGVLDIAVSYDGKLVHTHTHMHAHTHTHTCMHTHTHTHACTHTHTFGFFIW